MSVSAATSDLRLRLPANRTCGKPRGNKGFTLVELVMVILLLGIMATFSSQFIATSSQLYGDASNREQLMSDARFVMERLNREVRDAVPGSERIEALDGSRVDQGPCLRFWPIATSGRYLARNQTVSGAPNTLQLALVAPLTTPVSGDYVAVFPVPAGTVTLEQANGCDYGRCVAKVTSVGTAVSGAQAIQYARSETLAGESPGLRAYFARQQVRYCIEGSTMTRASGAISAAPPTGGQLMAELLQSGIFYQEAGAFNTEGTFGMRLVFTRNGESVTFNHKVGVLNVP